MTDIMVSAVTDLSDIVLATFHLSVLSERLHAAACSSMDFNVRALG